jgi:dipeptidyl aminopeptidase/acylaminoacyl peptidase
MFGVSVAASMRTSTDMPVRGSLMRRLGYGICLVLGMSLMGCISTPAQPPQTIGFTRAAHVTGTESLWVMKDDGSEQVPLNVGDDGNRSMTWSPDGNSIAFESLRDGNLEIYTARILDNRDGTYSAQDVQRRTTAFADDSFPAWSHDCSRLAFSSKPPNQSYSSLYQLDLSSNTASPLTTGYEDSSPAWSPDGSKIAFTRSSENVSREIYVHVISSAQDIRLTNNAVDDRDPSWSPSGRIIFARHSEDGTRSALFEMDAVDANGDGNGDHLTAISAPQANEYDQKPEYSDNGKAVVFFRSQEAGGGGPGDVWKLVIQDGTVMEPVVNLTQTKDHHEHGATWRPNGICPRRGK